MKTGSDEDKFIFKLLKIRDDKLRSWKLVKLHINEAENEVQHFQNAISTIESFFMITHGIYRQEIKKIGYYG